MKKRQPVPDLVIRLHDPGMTPLLRAGLGGLASSLRAILRAQKPRASWPSPVPLGPGLATVEPQRVIFSWGKAAPERTLKFLFEKAFRIRKAYGLIDLPGACEQTTRPEVLAALQDALLRAFLQHGLTRKIAKKPIPMTFEIDNRKVHFDIRKCSSFAHQGQWRKIAKALPSSPVPLAGWAYPGAAQRHIGFGSTRWAFTPGEAVCGCFALVGCLSFLTLRNGGAVVVPDPVDLVRFAEVRPTLTPVKLTEVHMAGVTDAVLWTELALRMEQKVKRAQDAVAASRGFHLRPTPWAKQQKSRVATIEPGRIDDKILDAYDIARRVLPARIVDRGSGPENGEGRNSGESIFIAPSEFRRFITDNLAAGRSCFHGFGTAKTDEKPPRFLHYYRSAKNLGALRPDERKGVIAMVEKLDETERALVESVHTALRQRFGAIAEENRGKPAAMKNRWQAESDRWRYAFAGAKTADQIRKALADLWSRAGANRTLQERWEAILPLLRPERWQTARDLGLVALASYQGQGSEEMKTKPANEKGGSK